MAFPTAAYFKLTHYRHFKLTHHRQTEYLFKKSVWRRLCRATVFWLAGYDLNRRRRVAFHMQREEWSIHFNVTPDADLFTGVAIGGGLGFWEALPNGQVAALIGNDIDSAKASNVPVHVLNPSFALNRYSAALMNGYAPSVLRVVAVGLGAHGSQIVPKLIRGGFGSWILIDKDYLLPHNVARHELTESAVGYPKAGTMQVFGNNIIEGAAVTEAIVADILLHQRLR